MTISITQVQTDTKGNASLARAVLVGDSIVGKKREAPATNMFSLLAVRGRIFCVVFRLSTVC